MGRGNYCPKGEVTDQWYLDHDFYMWNDDEHEEYEIDAALKKRPEQSFGSGELYEAGYSKPGQRHLYRGDRNVFSEGLSDRSVAPEYVAPVYYVVQQSRADSGDPGGHFLRRGQPAVGTPIQGSAAADV